MHIPAAQPCVGVHISSTEPSASTTAWKSALHSFSSGGPPVLLLSPAVLAPLLSVSLAEAG